MQLEQTTLWEKFYSGDSQVFYPSKFAESVLPQLTAGWDILDAGCGNGRDSIFFANNGMNVTAVDRSREAILHIKTCEPRVHAVCGDILTAPVFAAETYDGIYSRFFIHALTAEHEEALLKRCYMAMRKGGRLFIETRCTEDGLCGVGDRLSDTEWVLDGHYRRFIVPEELTARLSALGFVRIYSICAKGFAPFQNTDPVILRITAEK